MRTLAGLLAVTAITAGVFHLLERDIGTHPPPVADHRTNPFVSARPLEALKRHYTERRVHRDGLALPAAAQAATRLYRWRDDRGNWQISDKPPRAGTGFETRDYPRTPDVPPAGP